jgi:putative hydrolase of the HAD superfamily
MIRQPIAAVCFDLDGTLLRDDHLHTVLSRVAVELVARFPGADITELIEANARLGQAVWSEDEVRWYRGEISTQSMSARIWRASLLAVGVSDSAAPEDAARRQSQLEHEAWCLYDEAADVLGEVRRRGIRTAIITNGPSELQRAKLDTVGLSDAFDAVIVSGELGVEKPRPEIFTAALDALRVEPGHALHIGDNPRADVAGATSAGLTAVWVDRSGGAAGERSPVAADAVVADLRGLLALLG